MAHRNANVDPLEIYFICPFKNGLVLIMGYAADKIHLFSYTKRRCSAFSTMTLYGLYAPILQRDSVPNGPAWVG